MGTATKKAVRRKTTKTYFFRSILYQIAEFFKENRVQIAAALIMAITWLAGFLLGAMMMAGFMGGI